MCIYLDLFKNIYAKYMSVLNFRVYCPNEMFGDIDLNIHSTLKEHQTNLTFLRVSQVFGRMYTKHLRKS